MPWELKGKRRGFREVRWKCPKRPAHQRRCLQGFLSKQCPGCFNEIAAKLSTPAVPVSALSCPRAGCWGGGDGRTAKAQAWVLWLRSLGRKKWEENTSSGKIQHRQAIASTGKVSLPRGVHRSWGILITLSRAELCKRCFCVLSASPLALGFRLIFKTSPRAVQVLESSSFCISQESKETSQCLCLQSCNAWDTCGSSQLSVCTRSCCCSLSCAWRGSSVMHLCPVHESHTRSQKWGEALS